MSKKVYLSTPDMAIESMFFKEDWVITRNIGEANLIQFVGGDDVTPDLYKHPKHKRTFSSIHRDNVDMEAFHIGRVLKIPMAGICRGGQFLHVMNGGSLYQHSIGHASFEPHEIHDLGTDSIVKVSSTHHQIMKNDSRNKKIILATAPADVCELIEDVDDEGNPLRVEKHRTLESIFYPETRSLCFQPHPEFTRIDNQDCKALYFLYLEELLNKKDG